jgi:hypothetical protein
MDLAMVRAHLAEAEQHIALGERHIARQIEIIAGLERGGNSTLLALDLLATYRKLQEAHVAHRENILRELEQ